MANFFKELHGTGNHSAIMEDIMFVGQGAGQSSEKNQKSQLANASWLS
jgi:hypothetical protein